MGRVDLAESDSCGCISVLSGYGDCLETSLMSDTPRHTLSGFLGCFKTPGGWPQSKVLVLC
jgi:hypothetical protein